MADINRLPSELEVGVFSDNLLSTQLDTQERIAALYSTDFNVPNIQHSIVPKHWNTDDILKSPELPSATDYLNSNDPKVREVGKNLLSQDSERNTALTKGVGLPSMVRYQDGQEKFSQGKFGFNPYVSMAENEDFYWNNVWNQYSFFGKAWRGVGTFSARAATKLVTGLVGMVGDLGAMAWNGLQEITEAAGGQKNNFWADVSDNWLARSMEEANDYVKERILPTYKKINYDDKGAFAKLTDPYFWMNDISDGVGFLLQFAIPATLFGKAAMLGKAGKLGRFGKVMATGVGELPTASRLSKGVGTTLELLTGSRNVGGITAHAFNTTMESVAETKEGFDHTVKDLIAKGYTEHEAKQIAAENSPSQFGMNMAILSFSNALENRWFQKFAGNTFNPTRSSITAAGRIAEKPGTWAGKFFADNKWGNRIYFYGKEGAKGVMMEGYWEENAQLAAQRVAAGEYMRRGEDTLSSGRHEKAVSFWKQLIKQTHDAANSKDREAADSIMAGAVIGILGSAGFSKFSGSRNIPQNNPDGTPIYDKDGKRVTKRTFMPEGARKQQKRENAELVAQVRNAQDAWLNVNLMPEDMYDENREIIPEKAQERLDEINAKLAKITSVFHRKMTIDDLTDQTQRESLQYRLFGDYVKAHVLNGSGEALVNRLKAWGNKSKEELAMYGVTEEIAENPLVWAQVAQDMIEEYKNIDKIRYENNTNETVEGYFQKERALKSLIFDYIAQKQAAQNTANVYAAKEAEANPFKSVDTFNSYNNLIARREILEETLKVAKLSEEHRVQYEKELAETNKHIEDRQKSLPEHAKGENSAMVFEVGSNVKSQEAAILKDVNEFLHYQFAKEEFERVAESADKLIDEYSDPVEGLKLWNEVVDFWAKKSNLAKLKSLGWAEAEILEMTPEQQAKLIEEGKKKEEPVKEEKKEEAPVVTPTFEEVRDLALKVIQSVDATATLEKLDEYVDNLIKHSIANPDDPLINEQSMAIVTKYVQMRTAQVKKENTGEATEESKQETQDPVGTGAASDAVVVETQTGEVKTEVEPDTSEEPIIEPVVEATHSEQQERTSEPDAADIPLTTSEVPKTLIDEVKEAYRLHQKALENDTKFKEEAEREGMKIHNNRIDKHSDESKERGEIGITTSNPKELHKGALKTEDNNLARFNFIDRLMDGTLDMEDFKMTLAIGKNDGLFGIISDVRGTPINIGEDGMPTPSGMPLWFFLDYDMFSKQNIGKRRSDVVKPPFPLAPLATRIDPSTNLTEKTGEVFLGNVPIQLHPAFVDNDVIAILKDEIRRKIVTASLTFLTSGLLYRTGTDNTYSKIPKGEPTHSATELWGKGHLREEKGVIPLEDININGVYRRAHRILFPLLREIGNREAGAEMAEFHPVSIGELKNEKGEKIFDTLKTPDGKNFFQAAIEGNLEANKENLATLTSLLRPDKFLVLNLGAHGSGAMVVINLKKFKKFLNSDNITVDELRALTTLDDIKDSELNFSKAHYDNENEVEMIPGVLGTGRNNYLRFVNNNVMTSAEPLKKGDKEGYARINKRIALTLDKTMDDMVKAVNQKTQENKSPEVTEVSEGEELDEKEKKAIIKNPEEDINLEDDFTNTECKT